MTIYATIISNPLTLDNKKCTTDHKIKIGDYLTYNNEGYVIKWNKKLDSPIVGIASIIEDDQYIQILTLNKKEILRCKTKN